MSSFPDYPEHQFKHDPRSPDYEFGEYDDMDYDALIEAKKTIENYLDEAPRNWRNRKSYDHLHEITSRVKYYERV